MPNDTPDINRLDPEQYTGLIRAALHPDERKFFKEYLGQESPDIKDYLLPQGRFAQARQVREDIVRSALSQMIPSQSNPMATLAEARSISPDFPAPPNALSHAPAEGPGPPVRTGVIPGQGMSPELLSTPTAYGTMADSVNRLNPSGPAFMQEGPRPVSPVPTEDLNALLPRSHQNLLIAKTHQAGLRPYAPGTMLKSDAMARYRDLMTGTPEDFPGEAQKLESFLNMSTKVAPTGSDLERTAKAKADIAEADARTRGEMNTATLNQKKAGTENTQARTQTENLLRQARLDKLVAQAELAQKNADLAGDMSASEQAKQRTLKLNLLKYGVAQGIFNDQEQESIINSILQGTDLQATREKPSMIREFFGLPGTGVHVQPREAVPPTGNPLQVPGGVIMPQQQGDLVNPEPASTVGPGSQAEGMDKKAMAKALYDRMKEGDVQTFDGVKYKKQGSKLIRVQ